jgi:hypothetical protein
LDWLLEAPGDEAGGGGGALLDGEAALQRLLAATLSHGGVAGYGTVGVVGIINGGYYLAL